MQKNKHLDVPGSPAWHARRARCFNAGDAPAMLSCSPHETRSELLHRLHTGLQKEFSDFVQERVIDPGHTIEAACRWLAEDVLGEELQVLSYSLDVANLSRPLGGSLDGVTFMEDTNWECKRLNEELRAALPHSGRDSHERNEGKGLPKDKRVQMEQQMLVNGAKRTLFSAAELGPDGQTISDERHAWYYPDPALRAEILGGWRQFAADLAAYVPVAPAEKVRAEPVEDFPVMAPITMTGDVAVQHELDSFKAKLKAHLAQLPKDPKTDQEFANLEDSVKRRDALEKALKAERERALRGSPNIAQLLTTIDDLLAMSKDSRLADAEKVAAKKEAMRLEIKNAAQADFDAHIRGWNERLGRPLLSTSKGTCPDAAIAQGMHGKKSVKGWREGASAAVNAGKIAVTLLAEKVEANLAAYKELCAGSEALFRDIDTLLFKDVEAFRVICTGRIEEAKRQEEARLDAERDRIRTEEEAKARAKAAQEQQEREAAERRQREEAEAEQRRQEQEALARAAAAAPAPTPAPAAPEPAPAAVLTPAPQLTPVAAAAPAANEPPAGAVPTLRIGAIAERLGWSMTAEQLRALGIQPAGRDRAATLYHEHQFPAICEAIAKRALLVREDYRAAA